MTSRQIKWILAGLAASALLLGAVLPAHSQTEKTVRYKEVHNQIASNVVLIGDPAQGHLRGAWVRRGLTIFEDGEVAAYSALGDFDITKGKGSISGYDTTFFDDGSSWSTKFTGQFSVGPKGLWVIPHEGEFVAGTGRFEGITGKLVYTSRQINKHKDFADYAETEGSATYTVPPKPATK